MGAISSLFGYVLNWVYEFFNNYGIAIIILTVLLKIVLIPITIKQQSTMKKSAKIQEQMKILQVKYKNNPEQLNQEMMNLYKTEKMSPFSGCFSSIIQLIIVLSMFWLVSQPLTYMKKVDTEIIDNYKQEILQSESTRTSYPEIAIIEQKGESDPTVYLNMDFLGINLSKVPTQNLNDWRVYIIPILYILTSVISVKMTMSMQNKKNSQKENKDVIIEDGKVQEEEEINPMEQMNRSMMYMMPIMAVMIASIAPLGLALYWLVSNILTIIERLIINKVMAYKEKKEAISDAK
jgi:YidC/Oxa1 family membrane protein insertase